MLVVMVGLPGSGKSTYANAYFRTIVSPDRIRVERFGVRFDLRHEDDVWRESYAETAALLASGAVVCFDATSVTQRRRRMLLSLAHNANRPAIAIYLDVPVDLAWDRNEGREAAVPRSAFWQLVRALEPPSVEEGFAAVSILRTPSPTPEP